MSLLQLYLLVGAGLGVYGFFKHPEADTVYDLLCNITFMMFLWLPMYGIGHFFGPDLERALMHKLKG